MGSKKQRKTREMHAKKKKRTTRIFFFSLMAIIGIGFLIFFVVSLLEYVYPPVKGTEQVQRREKYQVTLYFSDSNERFLKGEKRYVLKMNDLKKQVAELAKAVIEGPHSGLTRTIPEATELRGVRIEGNTAYLDFSRSIRDNHPGSTSSEIMTVYSLTNTINANIPEINRFKLLVDGKDIETLNGHISTKGFFSPNSELIVEN